MAELGGYDPYAFPRTIPLEFTHSKTSVNRHLAKIRVGCIIKVWTHGAVSSSAGLP